MDKMKEEEEEIEMETEMEEEGREDGVEVGPRCPHCEIETQWWKGIETCPVHGPVLI